MTSVAPGEKRLNDGCRRYSGQRSGGQLKATQSEIYRTADTGKRHQQPCRLADSIASEHGSGLIISDIELPGLGGNVRRVGLFLKLAAVYGFIFGQLNHALCRPRNQTIVLLQHIGGRHRPLEYLRCLLNGNLKNAGVVIKR